MGINLYHTLKQKPKSDIKEQRLTSKGVTSKQFFTDAGQAQSVTSGVAYKEGEKVLVISTARQSYILGRFNK